MEIQSKSRILSPFHSTAWVRCLKCSTSSPVSSRLKKINLLHYSSEKCLFVFSVTWWSNLLSEHVFTQNGLLLAHFRGQKMLLLECFSYQSSPQSDCWFKVLGLQQEFCYQIHLPTGKQQFASSQCREKQSLFNLESGKQEWNKNVYHSAPLQLSFTPPGTLTFVCHHFQSSHFLQHSWGSSAFCSQVLLRVSSPSLMWQRMLIHPIGTASPPRGHQHWQWERKGWLRDSTPSSVPQILMHKINSCGEWVTGQRYPCVGSYSMCPAVNTNQVAELEGRVGSSSALTPLSAHLWKGIPPSVSSAVLGRLSAVTISNWYYFLSVYIFTPMEDI